MHNREKKIRLPKSTQDLLQTFVEVELPTEDKFLVIKETLTRIGLPSSKTKTLYQTCHILQKRGRYYIVHFKELFALDGNKSSLTEEDIARRNAIVRLLEEWNLVRVLTPENIKFYLPSSCVRVIPYSAKKDWDLVPKHSIGVRNHKNTNENNEDEEYEVEIDDETFQEIENLRRPLPDRDQS